MPSSAILMTKAVFVIIFLMLWVHIATAQVADQTIFTIDIHANGDAVWTVEKRMPLTTSELNEWEVVIKKGQSISRYQNQIKTDLDGLLRSAQNSSNRSMGIENLNISYSTEKTLSSATGIILYSFEWKNFSRTDSGNILIGDIFSEGSAFSSDNTLIINIPSGFEVLNVSPRFDKQVDNRLIWNGQSFSKGEPSLILTVTVTNPVPGTLPVDTLSITTLLIPAVILISGTLFAFWKWRRFHSSKGDAVLTYSDGNGTLRTGDVEAGAVQADDVGTGFVQPDKSVAEAAAQTDTESVESQPSFQYPPEEFLGDEEMIERYLTKCGGQAYQSDIVRDSGLSKSKISIVLAKMKEDGKVLKIKKGKENIIRLAVKKE